MKTRLVKSVLLDDIKKFKYFFHDYIGEGTSAPGDFVLQVMTNLDSHLYAIGQVIVQFDEKVESVGLIHSGQCVLNGRIKSRGKEHKVELLKLLESSWYGEFQAIHDLESPFELKAQDCAHGAPGDQKPKVQFKGFVHIYKLDGRKLYKLCQEYPRYKRFLELRAT